MRLFQSRPFARFARREKITDETLREAITRARRGLIDADLGGGIIKQRVARTGQGRSGGYRVLIAIRPTDRAVFMLGFAKNDRPAILLRLDPWACPHEKRGPMRPRLEKAWR